MPKKKHPIRSRKKGDPITIDACLPLATPDLEEYFNGKVNIDLTVSAMPDDWTELYSSFRPDSDEAMLHLGRLFYLNVIDPVWEVFFKPFYGPPSLKSDSLKYVAAATAAMNYYVEQPANERPDSFEQLIENFRKRKIDDIYDKRFKKEPKLLPSKIVFYLWKDAFASRQEKDGRPGPKNIKSFQQMYVQDNTEMDDAKNIFEKVRKETPSTVPVQSLIKHVASILV